MKLSDLVDITPDDVGWSLDKNRKELEIDLPSDLWHGLNKKEDAESYWLATRPGIEFTHSANMKETLFFSRDDVRISDPKRYTHGGHRSIVIDCAPVWSELMRHETKAAVLKLRVRLATGWTCGFSIPGSSFVAIAKRVQWEDVDTDEAIKTVTHELGHRFGLAASGDVNTSRLKPWTPDHHDEYYDDDTRPTLGHAGRHCSHGVTFDANDDPDPNTPPKCEMWGADYAGAASGFCAKCKKSARKIDVSNVQR